MNKIEQYYSDRINKSRCDDFLWQVGKTVNGKAVPHDQVEIIVKTITNRLKLNKNDIVLDIGCGNGLLTKKISKYVSKATGVELTPDLFEIAEKYHLCNNVSYINYNILNLGEEAVNEKYTKVYLYEVIQHFNYIETDKLFSKLIEITSKNAIFFIGGILDIEKKMTFFDSKERRAMLFTSLLKESDPLGTWYYKEFLDFLAEKYNLYSECLAQDDKLYTAHYRFDCLLQKK